MWLQFGGKMLHQREHKIPQHRKIFVENFAIWSVRSLVRVLKDRLGQKEIRWVDVACLSFSQNSNVAHAFMTVHTAGRERHRSFRSSWTSGASGSKGESRFQIACVALQQVLAQSVTELFFRETQAFPVYLVLRDFRGSQVTQDHLAWGGRLVSLDPLDHPENGFV